MSSKSNKKQEYKSKQKSWTYCAKCKLFFTVVLNNSDHVCPEKNFNLFQYDKALEQLFIFKNLVFLNTIEHPKGNKLY